MTRRMGLCAVAVVPLCWAAMETAVTATERQTVPNMPAQGLTAASETVLTDRQWRDLDRAVDRGLAFLAGQQLPGGSFENVSYSQPAVTGLCVMAFLSRGHSPGEGPYGEPLSRAIDYVLSTQQPNGLLCAIRRGTHNWKYKGSYNHAIAGVMLGEVYGMSDAAQQEAIRTAIQRALRFTEMQQRGPKQSRVDRGGWRYLVPGAAPDSDLSVTSWQLMFYRSARNAEFDVPQDTVDAAVEYVRRCFDSRKRSFAYNLRRVDQNTFSRSMAGAGILSLSLAGHHQSDMAQQAGRFLLAHPFDEFNGGFTVQRGRFFYGAYYSSLGMFQLGGDDWAEFFPVLLKTLVDSQRSNGSWDRGVGREAELGRTYSTSLAVLAITPPYQLLPIYQR